MRFELATCVLRPWEKGDENALVRSANNPAVARYLRDRFPHPYRRSDADAWIASQLKSRRELNWAVEVRGEVGGGVGLIAGDAERAGTAEIGYWLGEPHWGGGIMTEAVGAVTRHALKTLGFHRLEACVFEGNPASCRVLEKCGYQAEGRLRESVFKNGKFIDQIVYGIVG